MREETGGKSGSDYAERGRYEQSVDIESCFGGMARGNFLVNMVLYGTFGAKQVKCFAKCEGNQTESGRRYAG